MSSLLRLCCCSTESTRRFCPAYLAAASAYFSMPLKHTIFVSSCGHCKTQLPYSFDSGVDVDVDDVDDSGGGGVVNPCPLDTVAGVTVDVAAVASSWS